MSSQLQAHPFGVLPSIRARQAQAFLDSGFAWRGEPLPRPPVNDDVHREHLLVDTFRRLIEEPGSVCVDAEDIRLALGCSGRAVLGIGAASGVGRGGAALGRAFADLAQQGVRTGRARHAVIAVFSDDALEPEVLQLIYAAWRRWLHPTALPLLALRSSLHDGNELEMRALVLDFDD